MTAAESFDAGIARQIGQYADAVRVPAGYDHILVAGTSRACPGRLTAGRHDPARPPRHGRTSRRP
jgi:hypothetical protein